MPGRVSRPFTRPGKTHPPNRITQRHNGNGGNGMSDNDDAARRRAAWIEALEVEREGYRRAGKTARVAQVDAVLASLTNKATPDDDGATVVRRGPGRPRKT